MPIAIFLRRSAAINHFRRCLVGALGSGHGTRAWISSGFFQDRPSYSASSDLQFVAAAKRVRSLRTFGVYNGMWLADYKTFASNLKASKVRIRPFKVKGLRWHAKIFLLATPRWPLFALIGSSNITRSAFGNSAPFNYESDVAIWSDRSQRLSISFERIVFGGDASRGEVILADYDPQKNQDITIEQRLEGLMRDLQSLPTVDL